MPPQPLVDPLSLTLDPPLRDIDDVRAHNKQRFEMEMLSGIALLDFDQDLVVGFKHLSEDDFWVRGHIPGRPLLPGVLQIEAAAQATSYYYMAYHGNPADTFIGFMGVDGVKFRGFVEPNDTFVIAAKAVKLRSRRYEFYCQGFVRDTMVFEGTVLGAPM
jgi:3-hydroxyacyl-[acyl-carrier-protein] dehydratase